MSSTAVPSARRRYLIAAGMIVLAVALGALFGVITARAIAGYEITPLDGTSDVAVTVADRDLAIWVSPASAGVSCESTDTTTSRPSFSTTNASMTVSDETYSWKRVGVVKGDSGSTHTLTCDVAGDAVLGSADNPRVVRYVVLGVALGGTALVLMLSAFVLALVTALRRPQPRG